MKANEIKALLLHREITFAQIEEAIGVSKSAISATINYLRRNDRVRAKIAEYLGMAVGELFSEDIQVAPAKFRAHVNRAA